MAAAVVLSAVVQAPAEAEPDQPAAAPVAAEPSGAVAGSAALTYGRELFGAWCSNCHGSTPGADTFGPTLHGLFGRKAGQLPGYAFTPAITSLAATWDAPMLDAWLAGLATESPTTSVRHLGVQGAKERAAITAYIATLTETAPR